MKKKFTLLAGVVLAANFSYAQCSFSGLDSVYCQSDDQDTLTTASGGVFSGPGIYGNIFIPDSAGPGTHQINFVNITGYIVDQTGSFAPMSSPITGTQVALGDDQTSGVLPIGFTFNFFGIDYTDVSISSNGFLAFTPGTPDGCCTGAFLPSGTTPDNLIAFAWEDLDPGNGGQPSINLVQYTTTGSAPNRIFVVEFYNVDHWSSGFNVTTQTFLYETSNIIEVHTLNMPSDGGSHTQGIQNIGGTIAYTVPGRNSANWSATADYVAFIPVASCDTTVTVVVNPNPDVTASANPDPGCVGENVTFYGSGANSYSWNNGVTDGTPYGVTVMDTFIVVGTDANGCTNSDSLVLEVNPNPTISLSSNDEIYGADGSINLSILTGVPPYTFDWDNDGVGDFDDNNDLFGVTAGTYNVTMTDGNGCSVTMSALIGSQVGLEDLTTDFFTIQPNPTNGLFEISLSNQNVASDVRLMIVDVQGRRVLEQKVESQNTALDISSQENGVYYIKLITPESTFVQAIVLKK